MRSMGLRYKADIWLLASDSHTLDLPNIRHHIVSAADSVMVQITTLIKYHTFPKKKLFTATVDICPYDHTTNVIRPSKAQ